MKKRLFYGFLCFLAVSMLLSAAVCADTGPKPSVHIRFENMPDALCYGTLLSKTDSTGPSSAWDGVSEYYDHEYGEEGRSIWQAFVNYEDADGFYFLQQWWECSETQPLDWTYYPPQTFKILLYYPESGAFAVSDICQRYAFDSYFSVDAATMRASVLNADGTKQFNLTAETDYDYARALLSLVCRIAITILIELAVALPFGLRQKKLLPLIAGINVITQIILNLALEAIGFRQGYYAFVAYYILFELLVFALEAFLYSRLFFKKGAAVSKRRAVAYAFAANACSFAGGLVIANLIPGIF